MLYPLTLSGLISRMAASACASLVVAGVLLCLGKDLRALGDDAASLPGAGHPRFPVERDAVREARQEGVADRPP